MLKILKSLFLCNQKVVTISMVFKQLVTHSCGVKRNSIVMLNPDIKYECRFAVYVEPPEQGMADMHLIKLIKHENGIRTPEVKLVYDFQRPFWTVRKGQRNYEQHKEWLEKDKLIEGKAPQRKLVEAASRALGMPWFSSNLRQLSESPYLFGTDILSTAVIKKLMLINFLIFKRALV